MTIGFIAGGDPALDANLAVAQPLLEIFGCSAIGNRATRTALLELLEEYPDEVSIFSMSHGSLSHIVGADKSHVITQYDFQTLNDFRVFAWACLTGARLGYLLSRHNTVWWGYDCAVTAPDGRPEYAPIFRRIFSEIINIFPPVASIDAGKNAIIAIKALCEDAAQHLDETDAGNDENAFALYACTRQIWSRLSLWIPGQPGPIRHPFAASAYVDL